MNVHVRKFEPEDPQRWMNHIGYANRIASWQAQVARGIIQIMNPLTFFKWHSTIMDGMSDIWVTNLEMLKESFSSNPVANIIWAQMSTIENTLISLQEYFTSWNNAYHLKEFLQVLTEWNNETTLQVSNFFKFFLWGSNQFSQHLDAEIKGVQLLMFRRGKPEWQTERPPEIISESPVGNLLEFTHPNPKAKKVFLLAPISWHHATLLTPKVKKLMEKHTVIITDWHCASQIDAEIHVGRDQYIDQIIDWFIEQWDGNIPVFATCQPCPLLLGVDAIMEKYKLWKIEKMLLKAWPVDLSKNPTSVNTNAHKVPKEFIATHIMTRSPINWRIIYPGWFHLFGFIMENKGKHQDAQKKIKADHKDGKIDDVIANYEWYSEFMSYMNMTREYGLETHDYFTQNQLVHWTFAYSWKYAKNGPEMVDLNYITSRMRIVEWAEDEICGNGQTEAAFDLCPNAVFDRAKDFMRVKWAKHYSSFSGEKYRVEIYPFEKDFIDEPPLKTIH